MQIMNTLDTEYKTWTRAEKAADVALAEAERIAMRGYRDTAMRAVWGDTWAAATMRLLDGGLLLVQRTAEAFEYAHSATRAVGDEVAMERDQALALLVRGLSK